MQRDQDKSLGHHLCFGKEWWSCVHLVMGLAKIQTRRKLHEKCMELHDRIHSQTASNTLVCILITFRQNTICPEHWKNTRHWNLLLLWSPTKKISDQFAQFRCNSSQNKLYKLLDPRMARAGRRVLLLHKGICGYKTQCAIYDSFTYPSCCCTHHTSSCGDMIPLYLPNYITLTDNIKLSNLRMREATQEHHELSTKEKKKTRSKT
jgi:hypothetical protein